MGWIWGGFAGGCEVGERGWGAAVGQREQQWRAGGKVDGAWAETGVHRGAVGGCWGLQRGVPRETG